jgi:hypothetical protein
MKIIRNSSFLRICWLLADFLIIWLTVYLLPSPMSDDLRGVDDLPWVYDTRFIPILISPIYFMIWHYKKDIFIKSSIFYLSMVTLDWEIRGIEEIFSSQMFNVIFSKDSFLFILIFIILMSISYSISTLILKLVIRKQNEKDS